MYISHSMGGTSGDISSLQNVDYHRRYIIIENSQITVLNISSATGRDSIGIMKDHQRFQNTYVYHCRGNVLKVNGKINPNVMITVDDASYGLHDYSLNRPRFGELLISTSYVDMFNDAAKFSMIPNIRYYNHSHHILNRDIDKIDYVNGLSFAPKMYGDVISNVETVRFGDLIDEETTIIVTNNSNFTKFKEANYPEFPINTSEFDLDKFGTVLIGLVTDLIMGLLVNSLDFCYDSEDGLSRLRYTSDHKLPNDLYKTHIQGNCITQFQQSMQYASGMVDWRFRLMVKVTVGGVRIKIIKYDLFNNNHVTKDFDFEIGKFRNAQHQDALKWVDFNLDTL